MSLLDGLFGAGAQQALLGNINTQQQSYGPAQLQAQYSQAQQARFNTHQWVFNGKPCTIQEFANAIWGKDDHEDKMLFLLTHSGPKTK